MSSTQSEIDRVFALQKAHQSTVKSSDAAERIARLTRLRERLAGTGPEVGQALLADLGRPYEDQPFDLQVSLGAIDETVAKLEQWMTPNHLPKSGIRAMRCADRRYNKVDPQLENGSPQRPHRVGNRTA